MIIAIEGIDGSGKNTQTKILAKKLSEQGMKVVMLGFPCYSETFFGSRKLTGQTGEAIPVIAHGLVRYWGKILFTLNRRPFL